MWGTGCEQRVHGPIHEWGTGVEESVDGPIVAWGTGCEERVHAPIHVRGTRGEERVHRPVHVWETGCEKSVEAGSERDGRVERPDSIPEDPTCRLCFQTQPVAQWAGQFPAGKRLGSVGSEKGKNHAYLLLNSNHINITVRGALSETRKCALV